MTKKIYHKLFELISEKNSNDQDILKILQTEQEDILMKIINIPLNDYYQETMLMWAVWNLKKNVVLELIKLGANCFYQTSDGESVSTYWNLDSSINKEKEILATEIAEILFHQGVDLSQRSINSWSLVKRVKKNNLPILQEKLKNLGYIF